MFIPMLKTSIGKNSIGRLETEGKKYRKTLRYFKDNMGRVETWIKRSYKDTLSANYLLFDFLY